MAEAISKPRLPPFLQFRFPFNVILYISLPVVIPLALSAAFIKVSLDSNNSRKRLRLLEKSEGVEDRLANVLKRLDKGMENAVAELMQETEGRQLEDATIVIHEDRTVELVPREKGEKKKCKTKKNGSSESIVGVPSTSAGLADAISIKDASKQKGKEFLSPTQLSIIETLNTLPFEKFPAHFPGVFNSHAVIISRDVKRFPFHVRGHGVLRHWADHFIL
jgi:hypothetical protein